MPQAGQHGSHCHLLSWTSRYWQESTDGVPRTTTVLPGFVRTDLADSIDNHEVREQIRRSRDEFAISPDAVARAIAFAVEQPYDVEIGDITIRPAVQG